MYDLKADELWEADKEYGKWLHNKFMTTFAYESEAWAIDRVKRVMDRLQMVRTPLQCLLPEILWIDQMNAFILPGRYIYITRELLQMLASDDPAAFVFAHEIAHHDLGHLSLYRWRLEALRAIPGGIALAAAARFVDHVAFSPEHERAADNRALEMCLDAGYDGHLCLELFDVLQAHALDWGDVSMAYGPQTSQDSTLTGISGWISKAKDWNWQRMRGYPSIRERKEALLARLA